MDDQLKAYICTSSIELDLGLCCWFLQINRIFFSAINLQTISFFFTSTLKCQEIASEFREKKQTKLNKYVARGKYYSSMSGSGQILAETWRLSFRLYRLVFRVIEQQII